MEMMEFEINAGLLQRVLEATAVVIDEPTLVVSDAGISVVSLDEAKVVLVQLGLRKSEFRVYDIGEKTQRISFDTGLLASYLKGAEGTAVLTVEGHKIDLMIPSKYGFKTFEVPLLAETGSTRVPKIDLESRCKLDLGGLQSVVRDGDKVKAANCIFTASDDNLDVRLDGEKGSANNMLEIGKGIIDSQFTTNSKFVISLEWLKDVLRVGAPFTNIVLFEFSEKLFPGKFTFQVPFDGNLMLYVAPIDLKAVYK